MHTKPPFVRLVGATAAFVGVLVGLALPNPPAQGAEHSEDAVKAAYLYRFAGYVDWPTQTAPDKAFTIDVLGAPDIAAELRRLLPGHPIDGKAAQVREITDTGDIGGAQIVYVAPGHASVVRAWTSQTPATALLVVTDEEGGLNAGSSLNFLTIDRNVRFEVSLAAARHAGLKISSELLGVAIRVQGGAT